MGIDLKIQIHEACLLMQRCRISSYFDAVMSAVDRDNGIIAVKRSGGAVDLFDFTSASIPDEFREHIRIYEIFSSVGCIVHTHSYNVSIFANAELDLKPYALTGKHYFGSNIPCVCRDTTHDIASVIANKYTDIGQNPEVLSAVLIKSDGAFVFGKTPLNAADLAFILENNAKYAYIEAKSALSSVARFDILQKHNPARKIISELK